MAKRSPITRSVRDALGVAPQVKLTPESAKRLDAYLSEQIPMAIKKRDEILPRVEKWRRTIRGERAKGGVRRNSATSNISVPLLIWARVAVRARLTESIIQSPNTIVSAEPLRSTRAEDDETIGTIAKSIGRFMSSQILNARALNGRSVIEKCSAELVDLGSAAMKVVVTPGTAKNVGPLPGSHANSKPVLMLRPQQIKWEYISWLDLVYNDGFGTDTQAMPFIGHQFDQTFGEIEAWGTLGHYTEASVKIVKASPQDRSGDKPESFQPHDMVELYLDWDIDDSGIQSALLITWHLKARQRMRTIWNPNPDGRRPILMSQFDLPDDITKARGQGVSEKLEGSQDEVDAIHNIAIEAGKRGAAHLIVLKEGTRAEEELGGDTDIMPGDVVVTSTPDEDIVSVPLGNPAAAGAAIQLEEHTRLYVTRILGLDESRVGNVESGKRVTAAVGMASMKEGRMIIKSALDSETDMFGEATYLTIDLYKRNPPKDAIRNVLNPEEAEALINSVFSLSDVSTRDSFLIRVNARDASADEQAKKQEMLIINQALFPFYDRIQSIIMALANPEMPEAAKKPLILLVERMERAMVALLNTVETIPHPDELLIKVGEIRKMLEDGNQAAIPDDFVGDEADESIIGDLGGGVS